MSSIENSKYQEVTSFELGEGKAVVMEPVKKYPQLLAAVLVNLSSFAIGTALGWTSPVGPKLSDPDMKDTPLSFVLASSSDDFAWISSLIAIGALIAPFAAGILADKIGRKWTLLSSTVFFVVAYIMLLFASEVSVMFVARLLQGFGTGFVMTAQPMYIGEIATDDMRGPLGAFMQLFIVAGILYVYAIGPYVSYITLQIACLVIPILFAATFFFMPESPFYFIAKGKKKEALHALQFLRGQSSDSVQDEFTSIQNSVEEAMQNKGSIMDIIKNKGNLKALIICCGLLSFQQLSGINVVLFNSQTIFDNANSGLDPAVATILVGIVQVIASGCTPLIATRLGRKTILMISAAVMCVGLALLGLYFYLDASGSDTKSISWLPVLSLIVYVTVYCIGFGPLPWAVLGEMFAPNVKSIASSIVASDCWILGFLVTRFYPALEAVGTYFAFWLFAAFCACAFAFVLLVVMETKGLSLKQIQDRLNGR
ncbi:facilitated trehalose transporter Tret1 [Hermetia illucens]|uniref:facilitated trehalose transporter Tret1 n=1 Tax=Hermetia illucens TaxID=343691 RepID=UPI0018CC6D15|nr:facilitated trehalose transporter Tret1 [Hermetia illucens]XP_037913131.1 facilitated trehalose transporter Tret1 [Hermetia illucens]